MNENQLVATGASGSLRSLAPREPKLNDLLTPTLQTGFHQCLLATAGGELLAADPSYVEGFTTGRGYERVFAIILGKRQEPIQSLEIKGEAQDRCDAYLNFQRWLSAELEVPVEKISVVGTGWNGEGRRIERYLEEQYKRRSFDWTTLPITAERKAKDTTQNLRYSYEKMCRPLQTEEQRGPVLWAIVTTAYHALRLWALHSLLEELSDLCPVFDTTWKEGDGCVFVMAPYSPETSNDTAVTYCVEITLISHLIAPLQKLLYQIRDRGYRVLPEGPVDLFHQMWAMLNQKVTSGPTSYGNRNPNDANVRRVQQLRRAIGSSLAEFRAIEEDLRKVAGKAEIPEKWRLSELPRIVEFAGRFVADIRWASDVDLPLREGPV